MERRIWGEGHDFVKGFPKEINLLVVYVKDWTGKRPEAGPVFRKLLVDPLCVGRLDSSVQWE